MEQDNRTLVFQVDSEIVKKQRKQSNYRIEYNQENAKNVCAIYFGSNDIYFPNTEASFKYSIIEANRYEWVHQKIAGVKKHIFLRDIYKQWYLAGINDEINTPEKLFDWLRIQTDGYKIYTVGSSAGGYAAILYGALLNADKVYAFNPQLELNSLLETSEEINPLIYRLQNSELRKYYDLLPIVVESKNHNIFYFVSIDSPCDKTQYQHLQENAGNGILKTIRFKSSHHGIPFPKIALKKVLNSKIQDLINDARRVHNPIIYSINKVGLYTTITGLIKQISTLFFKKYKQFKQKR